MDIVGEFIECIKVYEHSNVSAKLKYVDEVIRIAEYSALNSPRVRGCRAPLTANNSVCFLYITPICRYSRKGYSCDQGGYSDLVKSEFRIQLDVISRTD